MPSGAKWLSNINFIEKSSLNTLKTEKSLNSKMKLNLKQNQLLYKSPKDSENNSDQICMNDLFDKRVYGNHGILNRDDISLFNDKSKVNPDLKKNYQSLIRPVCRKKLPSEQFDDLDKNDKVKSQSVNPVENIKKRPISTTNLMRPPSRHKSPPKALELEIPGSSKLSNSSIKIKSFSKQRPNTSKSTKLDLGNHQGFDKSENQSN